MKSILHACEPREDIIKGAFNPEIFTASLSEIIRFYRGESPGIHPLYTDARAFFEEATYPTDGLRMVLSEVFGRLSGDNTVPAIHRLETAFGGGKTHTLIACAHLGFKGNELSSVTEPLLAGIPLHAPKEVFVAGVAGDEIPVHKPKGPELTPYTLWGEIAYQMGGEALYQAVEDEAASNAAPGKNYFDTVFGGKKVLLMLDELAQYAARLSASRPDGADQLAAFLMSLHGYARTHPGMSILLTLASASDAFAAQTQRLAGLLSKVLGREVTTDDALTIGQDALGGVSSVVARDATPVVPVQAAEISRVLAKRLFTGIDTSAAEAVADAYQALYAKNISLLPDEVTRADYRDRMVSHYPFHPALIDFLNNKLATSEGFQGTRGVLRVLALAVRNLWKKGVDVPMIHTCHLDMRDPRIISEMVARTGSGELLPILNADIGSADTAQIEGGRSNAELADARNPHPEGWPMHEYAWKTVFLHSLVGRNQGLESNLFGINEQNTLLEVSFPGLTPPQVSEALKEISRSAFYLRYNQGRYYASLEPSVNIALAKIRGNIPPEDVDQALDATARKVVRSDVKTFHVVHDVAAPEHIPDNQGKPVLALVSLNAGRLNIEECITTAGPNKPRIEQNNTLLLAPETVSTRLTDDDQADLFGTVTSPAEAAKKRLRDLARSVLAMRRLKRNPQNYSIHPRQLEKEEFTQRYSEREKALETSVTEAYRSLWYPSANGKIVQKEIRTAGGEGGVSVLEQIRKTLLEEGELLTSEHCAQSHLIDLKTRFFSQGDTIAVSKLKQNFSRLRSWPILDAPVVLDQLIRAGINRGMWCLFRMGSDESDKPELFHSRETGELPLNLELDPDCSLVTMEGARQRGWTKDAAPDVPRIEGWIRQEMREKKISRIRGIAESLKEQYGEVPEPSLNKAIIQLVQGERIMAFKGDPDQTQKPNLISKEGVTLYVPELDDVVITPSLAAEKGWRTVKKKGLHLSGREGAERLLPLLRQIGSLYQRGGKSVIDQLDLVDMDLPRGGKLRLAVTGAPPDSMKDLGELFEVLSNLVRTADATEAYLDIHDPQPDCPFVEKLQKEQR